MSQRAAFVANILQVGAGCHIDTRLSAAFTRCRRVERFYFDHKRLLDLLMHLVFFGACVVALSLCFFLNFHNIVLVNLFVRD